MDTIPLPLFEHLGFPFLTDLSAFATNRGANTGAWTTGAVDGCAVLFQPEDLQHEGIVRELRDELLYLQCRYSYENPASETIHATDKNIRVSPAHP